MTPRPNPTFRYLMAMTNNDSGCVFSAAAVAGKLIAARRLRLKVTGIVSAIPDKIVVAGIPAPLRGETPAPVAVLCEPHPLMDIVALQAATKVVTSIYVVRGLCNNDLEECLRLAEDMVVEFGDGDNLKLLVRALLMTPYRDEGVWLAPNFAKILAADSGPRALAGDCASDCTNANAQPSSADSRPTKE